MVSGTVAGASLVGRSFAKTLTIDASKANFTDTLTIQNVHGLKVIGGAFGSATASMRTGRAVAVYDSSRINFTAPTIIGNGLGHGITVSKSADVTITSAGFNNLRLGLGIISSQRVRVTSGRFTGMTSDGINIADSHNVTANYNRCSGTNPSVGAHPDCIQLWSVRGNPVQSDIVLVRNIAEGATQGLTSFNAEDGGGLRITMVDNIITTSFPQGLACYNCVDSFFSGNVLKTLPGSAYQTSMNIVGGSNNTIINNSIGPRPAAMSALSSRSFAAAAEPEFDNAFLLDGADFSEALGDSGDLAASMGSAATAVPEPMIWAQLVLGFGLTGAWMRRRRTGVAA